VTFLVDTNVLSEIRKRDRADLGVRRWFAATAEDSLFLSVLVLGEIRQGVERKRNRDPASAKHLELWLNGLETTFADRLLHVDGVVADVWGRLNAIRPLPGADGLLAATAIVHGLTLVTRNTDDFARVRVPLMNPFSQ
jgi:toxin FitB